MGMIDRYRKKGGFVQLLNLIETTGKEKQEKFLKLIGEENPAWESEVRKKMLTIDKMMSWNPTYLQEIFPRLQPLQLAMVVGGLPTEKAEAFKKILTYKERKGVEDILQTKTPNGAEYTAGVMKLFAEIRNMVKEGSLKFEKFATDMVVEDNIEETLGAATGVANLGGSSGYPFPAQSSSAGAASDSHTATVGAMNHSTTLTSVPSSGAAVPANVVEELTALRKKLVSLTQDNQRLTQENQAMREKLDQIRKIA